MQYTKGMYPLLVLAVGTVFGSFVNVVIWRYLKKEKITGRSHCPHCYKPLAWWELIPLISFILLQARCRHCHKAISVQYPLLELWLGLAAIILFTPWPTDGLTLIQAALLFAIIGWLTVLAVIDLYTMFLPDQFIIGLSVTVVLLLTMQLIVTPANYFPLTRGSEGFSHLSGSLISAGLLLLLWLITKKQGIGFGDVKLMLPLGALLGFPGSLFMLWLAFVLGGLAGLWLLWRRRASLKTPIPFGPFLITAAILILLLPWLPNSFFFFFLSPLNY